MEGIINEAGHLMEEAVGSPQRAYAIRCHCFSFLLPWDMVMGKLSSSCAKGDFTHWPPDRNTAAQTVHLEMVSGDEALVDQFKKLTVRSRIVKAVANLYVENQLADLMKKGTVLRL